MRNDLEQTSPCLGKIDQRNTTLHNRVARWYIFKPKIPLWVNFGRPWNRKGWYILWPFGIHCGHLVIYLVAIWFIFPVLVYCVKKNLATLLHCTM
jgi:hypothetical protein